MTLAVANARKLIAQITWMEPMNVERWALLHFGSRVGMTAGFPD